MWSRENGKIQPFSTSHGAIGAEIGADMTNNVDATDTLQAGIDAAQAKGDVATAQRLYREQMGTSDRYGLEAPVHTSEGDDADQEERNKELVRREALLRKAGVAGF